MLLRLITALLVALAVNSCAVTPAVPPSRPNLVPPPGLSTLVIVRPSYYPYGWRDLSVSVNGRAVVDLANKSFTYVHVEPGSIHISGQGGILSWPYREKRFDIAPNEVQIAIWRTDWICDPGINSCSIRLVNIRWDVESGEPGFDVLKDLAYIRPQNAD